MGNKMKIIPYLNDKKFHPEQPWFVLNTSHYFWQTQATLPDISHFYSFKTSKEAKLTMAVPDGCVDILFDCHPQFPTARICGTTLEARDAYLSEERLYFGVRFNAGKIPDFLDACADEIPNNEFNFLDAAPQGKTLFSRIVEAKDFTSKIILFQQYYSRYLTRKNSAVTQSVIQSIHTAAGNIRIDQLAILTGYSCRTIQRQFKQEIGLSPKTFSRIVRCQSALNRIHEGGISSCGDISYDLGFSDQSHFLREFKRFTSTTPTHYLTQITEQHYGRRLIDLQH